MNFFKRNKTVPYGDNEKVERAFARQELQNDFNEQIRVLQGLYPVTNSKGDIVGYVISLSVGQDDIE